MADELALPTPEDTSEERIQIADLYGPLIELAIHGQDNKLNLLSSFLFFQSILLLAWATVWQVSLPGRIWILLLLTAFGVFSSIIWAKLGNDYDKAARNF